MTSVSGGILGNLQQLSNAGKQITGAKRGKTPLCEVMIGFDFAPNWLILDKAASFR